MHPRSASLLFLVFLAFLVRLLLLLRLALLFMMLLVLLLLLLHILLLLLIVLVLVLVGVLILLVLPLPFRQISGSALLGAIRKPTGGAPGSGPDSEEHWRRACANFARDADL